MFDNFNWIILKIDIMRAVSRAMSYVCRTQCRVQCRMYVARSVACNVVRMSHANLIS